MLRWQLEHVIRAAADVTGERDIVVVGSQAILGSDPFAPPPLTASREADVYARDRPDLSDAIDGALGEFTRFYATHGYWADGVGPETPKAPEGWQERLIPIRNDNTRGATGWCMEPHDLVVSKLAAGRAKDLVFARAAIDRGLVSPERLRALADIAPAAYRPAVLANLAACVAKRGR